MPSPGTGNRFSDITDELAEQAIELPSWAFGNSGTRFKVFSTPANSPDGRVAALRVPKGSEISRGDIDSYTEFVNGITGALSRAKRAVRLIAVRSVSAASSGSVRSAAIRRSSSPARSPPTDSS